VIEQTVQIYIYHNVWKILESLAERGSFLAMFQTSFGSLNVHPDINGQRITNDHSPTPVAINSRLPSSSNAIIFLSQFEDLSIVMLLLHRLLREKGQGFRIYITLMTE